MNHDAELQHQLRSALQEGLKEAEHVDVSTLEHQAPVEVTSLPIAMPTALGAQVQGMDIPEKKKKRGGGAFTNFYRLIWLASTITNSRAIPACIHRPPHTHINLSQASDLKERILLVRRKIPTSANNVLGLH